MDTTQNTQTVGYKAKAFEPRNLAFFFLAVLGLSWTKQALLFFGILKAPSGITDPSLLLLTLTTWGPTLVAFVITAITEGKPGVRALWRRFWNRNLSIKWLIVILLFAPALWLVANIFSRTLAGQAYPFFLDKPGLFFLVFIPAFFNGLSEEFGWRGYVLPRFQAKWNALASSLILGVIWASWHTRFFTSVISYFSTGGHSQTDVWSWVLWIITSSVFMTWIFNHTNGSILAAALYHAMMNAGTVFFMCCESAWHWDVVQGVVAILIVIIFGAKSLVWQKPEERTGQERVRVMGD